MNTLNLFRRARGALCWQPCAAMLLAALALPAEATLYKVGTGVGCTHADIQSAIDAAEANAGADTIRVSRSLAYTQQALVLITSQSLELLGGYPDCSETFDGVFTIIDGAGGATEPVMRITGNTGAVIVLRHLTIRNGDEDGSGKGGGIYFKGNGSLQIRHSAIINNLATYGGGIYAEGTGIDAELIIENDVVISGNTAREDGGGVYVEGLEMAMRDPDSIIANNEAQGASFGLGGGLLVRNTSAFSAYAYIGGRGVGALGTISGNSARLGGGVAVIDVTGFSRSAEVQIYSTDAQTPTAIRDNFAAVRGGGVHCGTGGDVLFWNATLADNVAPTGAALSLVGEGASLIANIGPVPPGGIPCPQGAPCGQIIGNVTADGTGTPTEGAVIQVDGSGNLLLAPTEEYAPTMAKGGLLLRDNHGGWLIDVQSGQEFWASSAYIVNAAIVDNVLGSGVIHSEGDTTLRVADVTIAGNAFGAGPVLETGDFMSVRRSILWQPGNGALLQNGGSRDVENVIANEVASLGGGPGAIVAVPRFVDPARGDYRLRAASPAIDFTAPIVGDDRDAHGLPRDQRIEGVPRAPGQVRDLGAFERPMMQPLVLNADFAGDLNLWTTPGGHGGVFDADNAPGSPAGTGSLRVSGNLAAPFLLGSFHCLHLPGPGHYRLNAWAHSQGATPTLRNAPSLLWEFRPDGGEGCIDGPITVGGEHFLNGLGGWSSPADPTVIVIPAEAWNHNSSLTILTKVYANVVNTDFNAWFDRITLELSVSGLPFADGFEDP